jgi:hypothetical protein
VSLFEESGNCTCWLVSGAKIGSDRHFAERLRKRPVSHFSCNNALESGAQKKLETPGGNGKPAKKTSFK